MNSIPDLSERLRDVFEFEMARGNSVERVDRPAGSHCPLAVIFARPLDVSGFKAKHGLAAGLDVWENHDKHYPLEAGYLCERTRQAIAGPIK